MLGGLGQCLWGPGGGIIRPGSDVAGEPHSVIFFCACAVGGADRSCRILGALSPAHRLVQHDSESLIFFQAKCVRGRLKMGLKVGSETLPVSNPPST